MNFKRIAASVSALACCTGVLASFPQIIEQTSAANVVCNDFEITYGGWYGSTDTVQLSAENSAGFSDSRGMAVTGRTAPSEGAVSEKGLYLMGGIEYTYSMKVYSNTDETFRLQLLYIDMETEEETTVTLAVQNAKAGEWTDLSAAYKAPANTYEYRLTLTTDSTSDFIFDNVKITEPESGMTANAVTAQQGLKDEFANYFRVGNILNGGTVKNSAITGRLLKDCNAIECENETKPDATLVQNGSSNSNINVSLNSCSAIADFCATNGLGFRGHTMVWHSQTPQWFFKDNFQDGGNWVSSSVMDQRMESYIKNMFAAFATKYPTLDLYAYDVCNECVSDDSNRTKNNGGARTPGYGNGNSPWVQVYGSNIFVEKAFTYADKYAPDNCKLFYNDYNEYWDHKRDCIYNMCKSLYEKGVLDGVGMQSHINADMYGFSGIDAYTTAMKKYLSIGCDVQITELDVTLLDNKQVKYTTDQQAAKYKAVFQAAKDWNDNPQSKGRVTLVQVWGPDDGNSWLGADAKGLLYNSNGQPKTAYNSVTSIVPQSEWGDGSHYQGAGVTDIEPDSNGYYFHDTFEGSLGSWSGRGDATIMTSGRTAYEGNEALLVQERGAAWNGATMPLNSRAFKPGETYSFSTNAMYFDGGEQDTFYMKLQYVDSEGTTQYSTIAEGTAISGSWIQLKNENYTIPSDASQMQLYVETADSTNNFYIDDAYGAVAGTKINGAGEAKTIIRGDVNCDGEIDVFDVSAAKKGLTKGFADRYSEIAADADQSDEFDVADVILINNFVLRKITEFPIAEKKINMQKMEQMFSNIKIGSSLKKDDENNPLYTQRFGADPGFLVYNDRLYVYTTNDAFEYDQNGNMKENSYDVGTINCISSSDLVNWTDHGAIPVAGRNGRTKNGVASWAFASWAPDACYKKINGKDKFFLYFANSGGGIGVLTADSPTGPWTDPLGHALLTGSSPNCSDVVWMFDPGVMVDDDGTGYLFFGGGVDNRDKANPKTGRCVKLGDDMISLAGTPVTMETPYLFEDSSITKIGSTYYYSYCSNWNVPGGTSINGQTFGSGDICYMTSSNPLGPWTKSQFGGRVFANTGGQGLDKGGNNHHSIVSFKNKLYVLYHTRIVENRMGINLNYRSPSISECTNNNGKLSCSGSHKGVAQLEYLDPYAKVEAETMSNQSGINVSGVGNTVVSEINSGDWIRVSGVNFSKGCKSITASASSSQGGAIKICAGSPTGTVIGYIDVPAGTKTSDTLTFPVNSVSGVKDIYFVFSGQLEFDSWSFSA